MSLDSVVFLLFFRWIPLLLLSVQWWHVFSSVLTPQPDRVSVETDSWTVNVCKGEKDGRERREGQPIPTPIQPPCTAILRPPTPPSSDPPGWKFLVCGPNSEIPNASSSTIEKPTPLHTHIWTSPHAHTHTQTHQGRDPTWFHLNSPPTAYNFLSLFSPPPSHPSSLPSFSVSRSLCSFHSAGYL